MNLDVIIYGSWSMAVFGLVNASVARMKIHVSGYFSGDNILEHLLNISNTRKIFSHSLFSNKYAKMPSNIMNMHQNTSASVTEK